MASRSIRIHRLFGLLIVGALLVTEWGVLQLHAARAWEAPAGVCPRLGISARPSRVELTPGFVQHQSWVAFPVRDDFSGFFAFCLDEHLLYFSGPDQIFPSGEAVFHLSTAWVNAQLLRGTLDDFRRRERWLLQMTEPE